jgi:hypothetical protein
MTESMHGLTVDMCSSFAVGRIVQYIEVCECLYKSDLSSHANKSGSEHNRPESEKWNLWFQQVRRDQIPSYWAEGELRNDYGNKLTIITLLISLNNLDLTM